MRVYLFLAPSRFSRGWAPGSRRRDTRCATTSCPRSKARARRRAHRRARARLRSALVGVQAAASLVLLVLAALLARGMVRATHVDVGFDAGRLLTVAPHLDGHVRRRRR